MLFKIFAYIGTVTLNSSFLLTIVSCFVLADEGELCGMSPVIATQQGATLDFTVYRTYAPELTKSACSVHITNW